MHDPRDFLPFGVGFFTAGIGGLSLTQLQGIVGIVAGLAGIVLTVATFYWRYKEHKCKTRNRQ